MSDAIFAGIVAVGVAALAGIAGYLTALRVRESEQLERHRARLRSLYADVMLAALRIMPREFPVRLGSGLGPQANEEIDRLAARLRLERWHEGSHILEELQSLEDEMQAALSIPPPAPGSTLRRNRR